MLASFSGRPPGTWQKGPGRLIAHTHRNLGRGNLLVPIAGVPRLFLIGPAWVTCSPLVQSRLRGSGLLSALLQLWDGMGWDGVGWGEQPRWEAGTSDPTGKSRCWYQNGRWRLDRQKQHRPTPTSTHTPRAEFGAEEATFRAPWLITGHPSLADFRPSAPTSCESLSHISPRAPRCCQGLGPGPGWSYTSLHSLSPHHPGWGPF